MKGFVSRAALRIRLFGGVLGALKSLFCLSLQLESSYNSFMHPISLILFQLVKFRGYYGLFKHVFWPRREKEYRGVLRLLLMYWDNLSIKLSSSVIQWKILIEFSLMRASLGVYSNKSTSKIRIPCLSNISIIFQCCHNIQEGAIACILQLQVQFSS